MIDNQTYCGPEQPRRTCRTPLPHDMDTDSSKSLINTRLAYVAVSSGETIESHGRCLVGALYVSSRKACRHYR
jgi:hypothetical protein